MKTQLLKGASISFAVVLIGFVVAATITFFVLLDGINTTHRVALTSLYSEQLSRYFDQRVGQVTRDLDAIASSSNLVRLVEESNSVAIQREEAALTSIIPHAVRVKIIPLGTAKIDKDSIPPFLFSALDMVNKVEVNEAVHPEAILSAGSWLINAASPIKSSTGVRGTLFVYLDTRALFAIDFQHEVKGTVVLVQSFASGQPTEIFSTGTASEADGRPISLALTSPIWSLNFYPSSELGPAVSNIGPMLFPLLILLGFVVPALFLILRQMVNLVDREASLVRDQVQAMLSGDFKPSEDYKLNGMQQIDDFLQTVEGIGPSIVKSMPKPELATDAEKKVDDDLIDIETVAEEIEEEELVFADESEAEPEFVEEEIIEEEEIDVTEEGEIDVTEEEEIDVSSIFRAYDIRGIVNETLTSQTIYRIGQTIGSELLDRGLRDILVGADGRISSPAVSATLIESLRSTGCNVINIGMVPTPLLYFATKTQHTNSGVMVTGSHNPPDYNGFKIVLDGSTLVEDEIQALYRRYVQGNFATGNGNLEEARIDEDYIDAICDDVVIAQPIKIVLDCGNGIGGAIGPELFESLGCEVVPLYCEVDGHFPNHHPDTSDPDNLADLISTVKAESADLGIALDGDADRLVVVTGSGKILWPDQLLMLFAKDVVSRNPGSDVVYDVKCTRHLNGVISGYGGRPIICRTGHSFIKAKLVETEALLGGEMSGHICFKERWYGFDDGLYSAARLIEIVAAQTRSLDELFAEFPVSVSTPEMLIQVSEEQKFDIVGKLIKQSDFGEGSITTIDGIRVDYPDGWGLVRASNTTPALTLRFEADNDDSLERIKAIFAEKLNALSEGLSLPF